MKRFALRLIALVGLFFSLSMPAMAAGGIDDCHIVTKSQTVFLQGTKTRQNYEVCPMMIPDSQKRAALQQWCVQLRFGDVIPNHLFCPVEVQNNGGPRIAYANPNTDHGRDNDRDNDRGRQDAVNDATPDTSSDATDADPASDADQGDTASDTDNSTDAGNDTASDTSSDSGETADTASDTSSDSGESTDVADATSSDEGMSHSDAVSAGIF